MWFNLLFRKTNVFTIGYNLLILFLYIIIRSLQSEPNIFLTWGFKDQEDIAYSPSRLAWAADFNCSCYYRSNSSTELLHFVAKVRRLFNKLMETNF
jgi:hypothetical protein